MNEHDLADKNKRKRKAKHFMGAVCLLIVFLSIVFAIGFFAGWDDAGIFSAIVILIAIFYTGLWLLSS